MSAPVVGQRILERMLERLFTAVLNGPAMNCRPHASRQRLDLCQLANLQDISPTDALRALLSDAREVQIVGRVPQPAPVPIPEGQETPPPQSDEQRAAAQRWSEQKAVFTKLRLVAEDAKTYFDDTGAHVLSIGFPILSLPPGASAARAGRAGRRILAPIAFIPVTVTLKGGSKPAIEIACREDEIDRVTPNSALLAWLERETGVAPGELFSDDEGSRPWHEVGELVRHAAKALSIDVPAALAGESPPDDLLLRPCPRADAAGDKPEILLSAVAGLFPLSNQALIRDTQALLAGESHDGPLTNFLNVKATLEAVATERAEESGTEKSTLDPGTQRLVATADPCQARAVRLAREARVLVVHGPPGTGKSQTITNIIGDHLAANQRVLFVCDKRTALDVVANRLEHIGLGRLCAVIHDPQRDQRELYRALREQLEGLVESQTDEAAEREVKRLDKNLTELYAELRQNWADLMARPSPGQASFHELVGEWLTTDVDPRFEKRGEVDALRLDEAESADLPLQDIFRRAERLDPEHNPWWHAAGLSVSEFIARPMSDVRAVVHRVSDAARAADATRHPAIPPFDESSDVAEQGAARLALAGELAEMHANVAATLTQRWVAQDAASIRAGADRLASVAGLVDIVSQGPLDAELAATLRDGPVALATVNQRLAAVDGYLAVARRFWSFLAFGAKKQATAVLAPYGLGLTPDNATRVRGFLTGLRARLLLQAACDELTGAAAMPGLRPDSDLRRAHEELTKLLKPLARIYDSPLLAGMRSHILDAIAGRRPLEELIEGLKRSQPRAAAIVEFSSKSDEARLFAADWLAARRAALRQGDAVAADFQVAEARVDTLEDVVRAREGLRTLPEHLSRSVAELLGRSATVAEYAAALRARVLRAEVYRRLRENPRLQSLDVQRIETMFERFQEFDARKKEAVRRQTLHQWVSRQKERLLAGTGSRLNSLGADLRRRLTLRGKNAMRLRQVIAVGEQTEGGDPLYDLAPVWMASPETVAQIFPRMPLFDVIVFDESSQCRLEEALPVLLRGRRVVIAGDPKQLPPTRFFESAFVESEHEEIATDQDLFEVQQGEIEDLLNAALSLDVQQSYLDVHYRSRNADLIAFSNEYFYGSRLQPIPGHPSNRTRIPPLSLYAVDGVFEDRTNEKEAVRVVEIVRDLLRRAEPPSIGIACFNVSQRDLISEKLDEFALEDAAFARRLAEARTRRGDGSFEGLFVKNLENVQGDERDHIIISTTYGRDAKGRFYRRFGPLGMPGGGRRLNVLVTRARHEVHLVTSIPREVYTALPPIPPGQVPTGGWLLFAYLKFAEVLAAEYEQAPAISDTPAPAPPPEVTVTPARTPSRFAEALARRLALDLGVGACVHWGNDAFSVDVALQHPRCADDVTVGVLCDWNRFTRAADPVEWEMFRTTILESQGWQLHRAWSTAFLRDDESLLAAIRRRADEIAAAREPAPPHEA